MEQEKSSKFEREPSEMEVLQNLYKEIQEQGGLVRELSQGEGYLTCVGDVEHFRRALGLGPDDEITEADLGGLPTILLFAYPASASSRVEAVEQAFRGWKAGKEAAESGRELYGAFAIAGGEMRAYLPDDHAPNLAWTVEFIKDGTVVFKSAIDMEYEPLFGVDASDVAALHQGIEELIAEHGLEG